MFQRLLLIFSALLITGASFSQNVMTPADGLYQYDSTTLPGSLTNPVFAGPNVLQKWVHDALQQGKEGRIPWDQSKFKAYHWGNISFRLRFPNNYNPASKYPIVIFLHGAGEAADSSRKANHLTVNTYIDRENQDQLFWGAQTFEQRINQGEWNGFLMFPQLLSGSTQWDNSAFPDLNRILDTLTKYNGLDKDRAIAMGLSAGGVGSVTYARDYPSRIATVVTSAPKYIETLNSDVPSFLQVPIWMGVGGIDDGPTASNSISFRDNFTAPGGNLYLDYYSTQGHVMWETQWAKKDAFGRYVLSTYWNAAHKAQPLLYFQNSQFCAGQAISAKMGLTPGYYAYEWQYDNGSGFTTIAGATSNIYTATQAGRYQVHFKRAVDSPWSAFTPNPVVITTKKCAADTAYAEHFEGPVSYIARTGDGLGNNSSYYLGNYTCQNGVFTNATEDFSRDATGRIGGRFMFNATVSSSSTGGYCSYGVGDQVWHNTTTVQPFTDYQFTFYMGNQFNYSPPAQYDTTHYPPAFLKAIINGTTLTPVSGVRAKSIGDKSWRKYMYTWNSGNTPNNIADIGIVNNTLDATWNDFVLDEISLVKYKAPPMPGAAAKNVTLWVKANSINGPNNGLVGSWSNDNINGDYLQQEGQTFQPTFKNNAADNINFNPIVNFNAAGNQSLNVNTGFSGSKVHNAVHAYIVANFSNPNQTAKDIAIEQGASGVAEISLNSPGILSWTTGSNTVNTPNNSIIANKPSIWTFSKDNIFNTGNGNKQDIRRDGKLLSSSNTVSTFTGNNSAFTLGTYNGATGTFDGNIAEIIYLLDSIITPLTQNRIESYLALKYGTTLGDAGSPNKYVASDSTTIFWPANAAYQNDVFGIGTDSASGLVQTRSNSVNSGSGDGTGQSAKGNLVVTTSNELRDKRFLMIGNDAGALTQQVITAGTVNPTAVGNTRVMRNWKVINTNAVGAVDLSFDTTGLLKDKTPGGSLSNYALMISNTGDATYSGPLSFITATGASGKKIIFTNVNFTSGAVFTIITNKLVALPAIWLGFTAEAVNATAVLNWKTSDEINVDRYIVEHSFNGVSFSPVGSVAANNSTGENNYTLTDAGLAAGVHYYRIRRTDKDGKSGYSDIKSIKITTSGANVQVRPNPVVGSTLVLTVSVQQNSKTAIQVMGTDGKLILHQNTNLVTGNNLVNLNIANVPPGIYLVQVLLNDEVVTKKFIKEK